VYRTRPDIGAVIHSHAPCAIAASLAGIDLMEMVISMAPVPTAEYAQPSSPESAERMRPFLQGYDWGILPRHGVVCLGRTPWDAFLRLEGLEHYAHIVLMAHATGRPVTPLGAEQRRRLLDFWGLGERGEARQ
jgi:L-fuculose-phosphate aldolase